MLPHILTVYQRSAHSKRFIAKKVHKESNELEIFKLLNTFQLKSEHMISLHDSFQTQSTSWAILPKMISLARSQPYGKVAQVYWGLINGVAYLHKYCTAHRNIKPDNLVVDGDFCLKMIDFDVALRIEGEDEVVESQYGMEGWMAPKMEEKSMYNPIKTGRWSTGQVLLFCLDKFREENPVPRTTAMKLTAHNPERLNASSCRIALGRGGRRCREEGFAISTRQSGPRRRKHEAPKDEEAETFSARQEGGRRWHYFLNNRYLGV